MSCAKDLVAEAITRGVCVSALHGQERVIIAPHHMTDLDPMIVRCTLLESDGFEMAPTAQNLILNNLSAVSLTRRKYAAPEEISRVARPFYASGNR